MDKVVLKVDYILKNTGVPDAEIGKANEMIHDVISEIRDTMNAQFQDNMRNRLMSYQMFLNDIQSVHSEDKCGKMPGEMPPDKFEEEMRCLERIKDKICQCVEVEKEWEKKVKQVLDQVERDHPLLFKVILSILSSVILGLLTSYIWEGIHLDQVAIYSSPNGSEPVYSEISAENVKLIQSQEDTEFYQVIIIEGERETAIGYIKEEDVIKLMEGELK